MRSKDQILLEGLYEKIYLKEKFDPEMGDSESFDPDKLIEYVNRILQRRAAGSKGLKGDNKKTYDYVKLPHIHASVLDRITVQTTDGETVDLNKFRDIIKQRPDNILRQNDKMKKSGTATTEFFNTSLPALRGLVIDEDTGEFKIINTCPSAGKCLLKCYAKHGSYILFPDVSLSQNKTLNYLFNDSEGYTKQLEKEILQKVKTFKKRNKQVQIRWNDSGDLLSPKYFDIVMKIINNTPEAEHYIYTKEVAMIKAYPNPPQNVIFNFSFGARKDQESLIDLNTDKYSRVVNTKNKIEEPVLNAIIKMNYIEKKGKDKWVYNNVEATKQSIAQRYSIDAKKLLTVDELNDTPKGNEGEYNVIVLPGESDLPASRRDVRGTYLMIH
jgi:hypothetical protein